MVVILAVCLFTAPALAQAQPTGKVWRVGFLYADQKIKAPGALKPFLDDPDQLPALFAEIAKERDEALLVWANPNIVLAFDRIQELTIRHRLPAMHEFGGHVRRGGLMAYGPKLGDLSRQAATYVDRIFKGANPGDLPIGQPTTFELLINLRTAKALGLTIPPSLLARADEVIR